jgi:hypothetical protein
MLHTIDFNHPRAAALCPPCIIGDQAHVPCVISTPKVTDISPSSDMQIHTHMARGMSVTGNVVTTRGAMKRHGMVTLAVKTAAAHAMTFVEPRLQKVATGSDPGHHFLARSAPQRPIFSPSFSPL